MEEQLEKQITEAPPAIYKAFFDVWRKETLPRALFDLAKKQLFPAINTSNSGFLSEDECRVMLLECFPPEPALNEKEIKAEVASWMKMMDYCKVVVSWREFRDYLENEMKCYSFLTKDEFEVLLRETYKLTEEDLDKEVSEYHRVVPGSKITWVGFSALVDAFVLGYYDKMYYSQVKTKISDMENTEPLTIARDFLQIF